MVNVEALRASIDLIAIAGNVTDLRKKTGNEFTGACPFCGGTDRFNVQAEKWLCRYCTDGKWQDAPEFVMRRDNVTFLEAVKILGGDPGKMSTNVNISKPSRPAYTPPAAEWQNCAQVAAVMCQERLHSEAGERARRWLANRGLTPATVERFGLGYSTGETIAGLYIPHGIVIPCVVRGEYWYLKVRTNSSDPGKKYTGIKGNRTNAIYNADCIIPGEPVLFCEGEFDCMLVAQEIGDVLPAVTLGAATNAPDLATWGWYLACLSLALMAYDMDAAGERGAANMAAILGSRAHYAPLPPMTAGKDITDYHRAGGSLWEWVKPILAELDPIGEGQ